MKTKTTPAPLPESGIFEKSQIATAIGVSKSTVDRFKKKCEEDGKPLTIWSLGLREFLEISEVIERMRSA